MSDDFTDLGQHLFTAEDIVRFARQFDPQPFHLSEEAGRASLFGGLAASGWHTASAWTRRMRELPGGNPERLVGFVDLRWLKPVLAGDVLTYSTRILGTETTEAGEVVTRENRAINQRGEVAFQFTSRGVRRLSVKP